jgi:hypothetical protein
VKKARKESCPKKEKEIDPIAQYYYSSNVLGCQEGIFGYG